MVTGTTHLFTRDAVASSAGHYPTLCGKQVLPATLTDPGSDHCSSCWSTTIPSQRSVGWNGDGWST
jgi:hypothetical protein